MTIKELYDKLSNHAVGDDLIIFKNSDSSFLANQYIDEIAIYKGLEITYIDDLAGLVMDSFSIFEDSDTNTDASLKVFYTDLLDDTSIMDVKNLIIVTNKIPNKVAETLKDYIIEVPKLLDWQIKDYVYSIGEGADNSDLDLMISLYGNNIYRIDQELSKLKIFSENERKYLLKDMIKDGSFSDTSTYTVFNITNAIINKDLQLLSKMSLEMSKIDMNPFGVLTILLRNFKNLIMVKLQNNPTTENTGIDNKQLYAIKKIVTPYTMEQIVSAFTMLSDIDRQIKEGEMPTDIVVDYMMLKILTM